MALDKHKKDELDIVDDLLHLLKGRDRNAVMNALVSVLATKISLVSGPETIEDNLSVAIDVLRERAGLCFQEKLVIDREKAEKGEKPDIPSRIQWKKDGL